MRLWLGLGNPGPDYARSRHNIGFMILDAILTRYHFPPPKEKFGGLFSLHEIAGNKIAALKPMTFMNRSGLSARQAANFYKIPTTSVLVFQDEIDLPFGKIRMKQGGGTAGHNGIRSLASHLGDEFWRLRAGVAHPGPREQVIHHVLGNFSAQEMKEVDTISDKIAELATLLAEGREALFANRLHVALGGAPS